MKPMMTANCGLQAIWLQRRASQATLISFTTIWDWHAVLGYRYSHIHTHTLTGETPLRSTNTQTHTHLYIKTNTEAHKLNCAPSDVIQCWTLSLFASCLPNILSNRDYIELALVCMYMCVCVRFWSTIWECFAIIAFACVVSVTIFEFPHSRSLIILCLPYALRLLTLLAFRFSLQSANLRLLPSLVDFYCIFNYFQVLTL